MKERSLLDRWEMKIRIKKRSTNGDFVNYNRLDKQTRHTWGQGSSIILKSASQGQFSMLSDTDNPDTALSIWPDPANDHNDPQWWIDFSIDPLYMQAFVLNYGRARLRAYF